MDDSISTFEWKSHIVLACITCEKVILFTRSNKDRKAARQTIQSVMRVIPVDPDPREFNDMIINLFLPTVCSSCDKLASWTSLSISRGINGNMATVSGDVRFSGRGSRNVRVVD